MSGSPPAGAQPERLGLDVPAGAVADGALRATVLFADIRGFTALADRLGSAEAAELLRHYFDHACAPVLAQGGQQLKFIGDGLMALFPDDAQGAGARRAVAAALGIALAAHDVRAWLVQRFAGRGLPPLAIGVGLHAGEVTLCRVGPAGSAETTAIGDTVNVAARLEAASKELGWTVVASASVLQAAGPGVATGGMTALQVRGKSGYVDVAELLGLAATAQDAPPLRALAAQAEALALAVRANSEITSGAARVPAPAASQPPRLRGYRLTRRLGAGGMTAVYLAERESDGQPLVLKLLEAGGQRARFEQGHALLARLHHPHVARIHAQGVADGQAWVAMEYFPRGDLRAELGAGMDRERALQVLAQVAQALVAVHGLGVVHGDVKPENVMRRADGSVALADFGIARPDGQPGTPVLPGEALGTPFYLSPEQAAGGAVSPASDLYSLGVMLFEMLAGERPFRAESLEGLLARHRSAPTPALPPPHVALQPILERLMAKAPGDRFASAADLLAELERRALPGTVALDAGR